MRTASGRDALVLAAGVTAAMVLSEAAFAQRTDDNATAESDDAFGRRVGNESIGIYNQADVRGFSPIDAGNVRIEGLYFDRQTNPTDRLVEGSAIRVGIAAQSYPFPSPTGIVDYDLRRAGDEQVISPVLLYGPFGSVGAEVDALLPVVPDRFGVAAGFGFYRDYWEWGGGNRANSLAIVPQWRPVEGIELTPFFSRIRFAEEEPQPLMLTADGGLPPIIRRGHYYGPRWAQGEGETRNYGFIGEALRGGWTVRLGLFESVFAPDAEFGDLLTDIDENGLAREFIVAFPDSRYASRSGELRVSRSFDDETRRHGFHVATKGRIQRRRYGGEDVIDTGIVQMGAGNRMPRPQFEFGEQSRDEVEQGTLGVTYELQWKNIGEMSVGVQKTKYTKAVETPEGALPETRAEPTLLNATVTVYATERFAIYGSYTEGLEESPVAPDNAVNRNGAAPALHTEQYDAGIRWTVTRDLRLIAGVFHIEKPYFDLDRSGFFRSLGDVEHRGLELSVAGSPVENLTVVAGTRILDAEVTGPVVEAGIIGRKPVASAKTYAIASVDYRISGTGVSLDAIAEAISRRVANTANTVETPGRAVLHLGGRYRFKIFNKPATFRAQVHNIFDKYGWSVTPGGAYVYNAQRRFSANLAMDL